MTPSRLWQTLVGIEPVTRRQYAALGLLLFCAKYVGDAILLTPLAGRLWTPADYLRWLIGSPLVPAQLTTATFFAFFLWTLAFVWLGIDLSRRRAIDAARPGWWGLGLVLPWANVLLIAVLAVLRRDDRPTMTRRARPVVAGQPRWRSRRARCWVWPSSSSRSSSGATTPRRSSSVCRC